MRSAFWISRPPLTALHARARPSSNEKYRGIRLTARPDLLTLQAHNPEQEEAEDQVEVSYQGEEVEIGRAACRESVDISAIASALGKKGLAESSSRQLNNEPGTTPR